MNPDPYHPDQEDIQDLLQQFENLRNGRGHAFLSEESFERIIDHFDELDQLPAAMEAADSAIAQYPFSCSLLVKKADLLIAGRRYAEALDMLRHAEILDSTDIDIYILKTDAYLAMDQQEKAVELLEEAIGRFDGEDRVNLLFELADVYDDYEEFDKIFDCLKLILESEPTNEEALYKICFWTDFTGRNEESIRLHQAIIEEQPYSELAWFNLAAAYQGLKLYEKSVDAYKYALAINEKFDYAYRNMADAFIRMRKYRDAIEALEKVVELSRPEDVIYEAIGHCYDKLKNFAQARFYYKKASHLNPEESKLHYKLACTYMNEKNWAQSVKYLELALKIHRQQAEYNLAMGECLFQMGRYKDAIQYFTLVVQHRPRKIAGWESLLRCLFKAGMFEEADGQARVAYEATGLKPVFLFYRAAILYAEGRHKEGLLMLESAMSRDAKGMKKLIVLSPAILQNPQVVDLMARYKRNRSI
jgi:tetratricopeptide (TPR) repeat protein